MDKYGFLLDDNRSYTASSVGSIISGGDSATADEELNANWQKILEKMDPSNLQIQNNYSSQPYTNIQSKVKNYARLGLPDDLRQKAWTIITNVDLLMHKHKGEYEKLVDRAEKEYILYELERNVNENQGKISTTQITPFRKVLDAIEKDIYRTFPNHYLFHNGSTSLDVKNGSQSKKLFDESSRTRDISDEEDDDNISIEIEEDWANFSDDDDISISTADEKKLMFTENMSRSMKSFVDKLENLSDESDGEEEKNDLDTRPLINPFGAYYRKVTGSSQRSGTSSIDTPLGVGEGRDALRRVLRAYSLYDSDIGYCQGMNFVTAMMLTFLSEEEAFWLLVVVMNNKPYKLRELFAEDMRGTLELLYIAEKLIKQFVPKLAKHLETEGLHVSMFITPWLLTLYTSTFPFDLVVRVWDSFLVEGWKVIYRVMLSLLDHAADDMLAMSFEDMLAYLKDFPSTVNAHEIMAHSLKISLKGKHIQKYSTEWKSASDMTPQEGNGSSNTSTSPNATTNSTSSDMSKLMIVKFDGHYMMGKPSVFINTQSTTLCGPRASSMVQKNKPRRVRRVSFSIVSIREYERILGDNPSVTTGPPIGIGWRNAPEFTLDVDEYEKSKVLPLDSTEFLLNKQDRENMLREHTNISDKEMAAAVKAIRKEKWRRHKTVVNLNMQKAEEKAEVAKRKAKSMLNKKSLTYEVLVGKLWHEAHEIATAKAKKLEESIKQGKIVSSRDLYSVGTPQW